MLVTSISAACLLLLALPPAMAAPLDATEGLAVHPRSGAVPVKKSSLLSPQYNVTSFASRHASHIHNKFSKRAIGTVAETGFQSGSGYYGEVQLGTPPQALNVIFDTGSADFWVTSSFCSSKVCNSHTKYNAAASSSYVATSQSFSIVYGAGEVKGTLAKETVNIGGIAINQQSFAETSQESTDFLNSPFDGIMGLGYASLANSQTPPPFYSMISQQLVSQPMFGFHTTMNDGEITFGGYDQTKFTGQLQFTPVVSQGYWQVGLDTVSVGSKALPAGSRNAIIDTGTTLIIASPQDADAIHAAIPGSFSNGDSTYSVPCDTSNLPTLNLVFSGMSFAVTPQMYVLTPLSGSKCLSGIGGQAIVSGQNVWIVGDVFWRGYYAVFDLGTNSVGFAPTA